MAKISASNGFKQLGEARFYLTAWSHAFLLALRTSNDTFEDLVAATATASQKTGISSLAASVLLSPYCEHMQHSDLIDAAYILSRIASAPDDAEGVKADAELLDEIRPGLSGFLLWPIVPPGAIFSVYVWQNDYPGILINPFIGVRPTPAPVKDVRRRLKSVGQQQAFTALMQIAKTRHGYGKALSEIGMTLPSAGLLIGWSGAGKTFIARAFAEAAGWPLYETSATGWTPQNAKSTPYTTDEIAGKLADSPLIIFIDEIDKMRTSGQGEESNYWRACTVEIMELLDRRLGGVSLTAEQESNFRRSWVLSAGAFQDLFKVASGADGEALFEQQVEEAVIAREDLEARGGLPTELLNRLGRVILVAPPTTAELATYFEEVEAAMGLTLGEQIRELRARDAVRSLKGFRGAQEFAIELSTAADR